MPPAPRLKSRLNVSRPRPISVRARSRRGSSGASTLPSRNSGGRPEIADSAAVTASVRDVRAAVGSILELLRFERQLEIDEPIPRRLTEQHREPCAQLGLERGGRDLTE